MPKYSHIRTFKLGSGRGPDENILFGLEGRLALLNAQTSAFRFFSIN
jgi:hypothetical protein